AQTKRPVVDTAGGGEGREDLRHAEADDEDECADDRPAPRDGDGAAVVPGLAVGGEAPRQDGDDRERDGKVGERAPRPLELLVVAELLEATGILVDGRDGRFVAL